MVAAALADAAAMIAPGRWRAITAGTVARLIQVVMICHVQMLCFCTWRSRCAAGNGREPGGFRATNFDEGELRDQRGLAT
jgi:hypothetical protein